jgi:hypothetical protein
MYISRWAIVSVGPHVLVSPATCACWQVRRIFRQTVTNDWQQGDRIGRIFAQPMIIFFGQLYENDKSSPNFRATFSTFKAKYALILTKMAGLYFGQFFLKLFWSLWLVGLHIPVVYVGQHILLIPILVRNVYRSKWFTNLGTIKVSSTPATEEIGAMGPARQLFKI